MNRGHTRDWLGALSPAEKMELAERLYDMALRELEASPSAQARRKSACDGAPVGDADIGYVIEPWEGFCDRLSHR